MRRLFENCEEKLSTLGNLHQPVNYDSISKKKKRNIGTCNIFLFYSNENLQVIYRNCCHWFEKCKFETNALLE